MLNRFLYFSRGQQIGIIVLLLLIAAAVALNVLLPKLLPPRACANDSAFVAQVVAFEQSLCDQPKPTWQSPFEAQHREPAAPKNRAVATELFDFDPNTLDSVGFVRLGLKPYIVQRIITFRNGGKKFRTAEFFVEFCHLQPEQSERLLPHVHIAQVAENKQIDKSKSDSVRYTKKSYFALELNAADTTELQKMPGIGSGRAKQIVAYRQQLGGFTAPEQLLEIKNFPPDLFDKIKGYLSVNQELITKIEVNGANIDRLKRHPYINFYQAKAIYELRRANSQLHGIDELRQLPEFEGYNFEKLQPYLDFKEIKYEHKRK